MSATTVLRAICLGIVVCSSGVSVSAQTYSASAYLTGFEALAGGGFKRVPIGPNSGSLAGAARTYELAVGTDVLITDALALAGQGGQLSVTAPATVVAADALAAIASVMVTGPGAVIVGAGVAAIVAARIYRDGGLHWDKGQPQEPQTVWKCANTFFGATQEIACQNYATDAAKKVDSQDDRVANTWTVESCTHPPAGEASVCHIKRSASFLGGPPGVSYFDTSSQSTTANQCPAVVDALNPAYSVPAGSPTGPDGKCRSGRYNHIDMTPAQAAQKTLEGTPSGLGAQIKQGLQDMWNAAGNPSATGITPSPSAQVKVTPGPSNISGPASQPGQPGTSTTTGPGGTTTTTVTPQYNYSYSPTNITYNTTTTTTINNPDGTTTTTTTNPPPKGPQDPLDPCTQHPESIGCQTMGELESPDLPDKQIDLALTPDTGWGSSNGVCPPPRILDVSGIQGLSFSWQPMCDFATGIRPVVIAVAWLIGAGIFMGFARKEA